MYYYFGCNYPAAIKINGIYYGTIYEEVKCLRIEENFKPLVEICALNSYSKNANFILEQEFLQNPPENFTITDLKGGYFIKTMQNLSRENFSIINQEKFNNAVVTVFNENGLKISIETQNDFFAETLCFSFESAKISTFNLQNDNFIAVFLTGKENLLIVYHINAKIRKVFMREVASFSTDLAFTTTEKFSDIAKHTVTSTWNYANDCFNRAEISCVCNADFNLNNLPEKTLPFAFFEEILAGGNYEDYLCDDMKTNAHKLRGFLGEFIGIIPPPKFRDINEVGLIYKTSENKYCAKYFIPELQNRKVINVKKSDY